MQYLDQLGEPCYKSFSKQYRSAIFYHTEGQREAAEAMLARLRRQYKGREVYIDVEPATDFYQAEDYHLKYIEKQMHREIRNKKKDSY